MNAERDKDFWDEFFEFVKAGRVIPILGPELLSIHVDDDVAAATSAESAVIASRQSCRRRVPLARHRQGRQVGMRVTAAS